MKGNHKGFSLVELIVALAILGIVAVSEVMFVTTGSRTYHSVLNDVNLQVDAQTAMNQLEDYIINCSGGLCFQNNTLYLINGEVGSGTEYVFSFDVDANELNYSRYSISVSGKSVTRSLAESGLMATKVEDFQVDYRTDTDGNIPSVTVKMKLVQGNEISAKNKTIALRNRPASAGTEDKMIQTVCVKSDS